MVAISPGWYDKLEKLSRIHRNKKNACRALHRLVESCGVTLPLKFDAVQIVVKRRKPVVHQVYAWWPVIPMRAWATYLLGNYPGYLLAGCSLKGEAWQSVMHRFWDQYRISDPQHQIFESEFNLKFVVPYCIHGDEGRGHSREPFLVLSWQPLVGFKGLEELNDSS